MSGDHNYRRCGYHPITNEHTWIEKPIIKANGKWYPVKRWGWYPISSEIVEYFQTIPEANAYCDSQNTPDGQKILFEKLMAGEISEETYLEEVANA